MCTVIVVKTKALHIPLCYYYEVDGSDNDFCFLVVVMVIVQNLFYLLRKALALTKKTLPTKKEDKIWCFLMGGSISVKS